MATPVVDDDELELGNTPIVDIDGAEGAPSQPREGGAPPPSDPRMIRRFTVLRRLGSGGMGVVYAAYDPRLDRRIALKLVRPKISASKRGETARTRLVREAQAMAKLSHPNVVTVYDVGDVEEGDDRIYIAMEFVKGKTLTKWEQQHPVAGAGETVVDQRSWKEVLEIFMQAGRGLAAAHKAGIIHRDFKPDNVLIGRDGRVRVLDFGLARADSSGGLIDRPDTFADALKRLETSNVLELRLTRTGGMTGTPAYMAPEQYLHQSIDARSDQFSFCVALYEGLYGERPFVGDTVAEVRKHVINGVLADEPSGSNVPPWLLRAVKRGLSVHPADRYPSMDALLAELSNDPTRFRFRARRRVLLTLAIVAVASAGAVGYRRALTSAGAAKGNSCEPAAQRLKGVWDQTRKQEIHQAFTATELSYAEDTWKRVEEDLDGYTQRWSQLHDKVCNEPDPSQSPRIVELTLTCLDQQLDALSTLSRFFVHANQKTVVGARAMTTSAQLGSVELCTDPKRLLAREVEMPEDSLTREKIRDIRRKLDEAELRQLSGQYVTGLQLATELTEAADKLDYQPLRAEAWLRRGALEEKSGDFALAEASLRKSLWAAEASGADETTVDALTLLVTIVGVRLARLEDAVMLIERLTAVLARVRRDQSDNLRLAKAENAIGRILAARGKYEEAAARQRRAVELGEQLFDGGRHAIIARFLLDLGEALERLNHDDQAREHYQRALEILEEKSGDKHPDIADPLTNLGNIALRREDYGTSRKHFQRVLELLKSTVDRNHPSRAPALYGLGVAFEHRRRWSKATTYYDRALRIWEEAQGPDHPQLALPLMGRCRVEAARGNQSKAVAECTRALAIREGKDVGPARRAEARFELAKVTYEANSRPRGPLDIAAESGRIDAIKHAKLAREEYTRDDRKRYHEEIEEIGSWLKEHPVDLEDE